MANATLLHELRCFGYLFCFSNLGISVLEAWRTWRCGTVVISEVCYSYDVASFPAFTNSLGKFHRDEKISVHSLFCT